MRKLASYLKRGALVMTLACLSFAALPAATTHAAGVLGDPQPGGGKDYVPRLEKIFESQQERFDHQTQVLSRINKITERVQGLIDRANAKGFDASDVQAALSEFSAAVPAAQTAHDQAGALIASHAGFDEKGKVTDLTAAVGTVRGVHDAFHEFAQTLLPPFRALRQAIHTFVHDNSLRRAPVITSSPTP